jgi:hypothetical protein
MFYPIWDIEDIKKESKNRENNYLKIILIFEIIAQLLSNIMALTKNSIKD